MGKFIRGLLEKVITGSKEGLTTRPEIGLWWQLRSAASFVALIFAVGGQLSAQEKKTPLPDADLVDKARNSVVFLLADARASENGSSGSGFFVAPGGQLVTNYHVIEGMCRVISQAGTRTTITVSREGGQEFGEPQLVAWDEKRDLAVLRVSGSKIPGLPLGDSDRLRLGEDVVSLGYPWSFQLGFNLTFTKGNVSSTREIEGQKSIQHTATIAPGSSGGPLLDAWGDVVGINYAQFALGAEGGARVPMAGNINWAIPTNDLRTLLSQTKSPTPLRAFCQGQQKAQMGQPQAQQPAVTQIFQSEPQCLNPGERVDFSSEPKNGSRPRGLKREMVSIVQHEQRRRVRSDSPAG
jgi:S1-C subfamily serine protease